MIEPQPCLPPAPWVVSGGALLLLSLASTAAAEPRSGKPSPEGTEPRVVVLRQPGLRSYEQVAEEFRGRVPAAVRMLATKPLSPISLRAWLDSYRPGLVLAIGQTAHDLARAGADCPVVSVLAFHRLEAPPGPARHLIPCQIPAEQVLRALRHARPRLRSVALLHGPGTAGTVPAALAGARALRIQLVPVLARTPGEAISRLREVVSRVSALWLQPDLDILSLQVFQYALVLQFRRGVALVGASRRHAAQGALLALDHSPTVIGRQAAAVANQILAASPPAPPAPLPVELSVNLGTAARIGANVAALKARASHLYQ
jgi:hypothetical protein